MGQSSIHSFNYIATARWVKKLFWIIVFVSSMFFCGKLIKQVDEKIPNSRVISLEDSPSFEGKVCNSICKLV